MNIAVFGLGRIGLPLALYLAEHGQNVIGVDIDEQRVDKINKGIMPFQEINGETYLTKHAAKGLKATTNAKLAVEQSDALILTLGTPVDEHINPVFTQIENALIDIAPHLKKGQLIVLRSTVSPGTTEHLKRFIEKNTSFKVGEDLFLAYCPERIAQGFSFQEFKEIPTIIGTLDAESKRKAKKLFSIFTDKILETDARSAELAKLFTNMYRYINFAIANEFMMVADHHQRSIHDIVNLVNKDYKRADLKTPGLTAGPCLFKDGFFLTNKIPFSELILTSWKLNESVPAYLIEQIKRQKDLINANVAILGLTFKKDSDDTRNSLSYKARKIFLAEGAEVTAHDPYVESHELPHALKDADIVFIAMNHEHYAQLNPQTLKTHIKSNAVICDVWNVLGKNKTIFPASELR